MRGRRGKEKRIKREGEKRIGLSVASREKREQERGRERERNGKEQMTTEEEEGRGGETDNWRRRKR